MQGHFVYMTSYYVIYTSYTNTYMCRPSILFSWYILSKVRLPSCYVPSLYIQCPFPNLLLSLHWWYTMTLSIIVFGLSLETSWRTFRDPCQFSLYNFVFLSFLSGMGLVFNFFFCVACALILVLFSCMRLPFNFRQKMICMFNY